jgi:5-methylcytosine-specific restriction endonuclease McrA
VTKRLAAKDRTHCPKGHPLIAGNLRSKQHRECLTCHRERELARSRRLGVNPRRAAGPKCGHPPVEFVKLASGSIRCAVCHRERERERSRQNGARPQWQCKRGHDMRITGQTTGRFCRECSRVKSRAAKWKDAETVAYAEMLRHDPCSYCGDNAGANERDHIVPRSRGGEDHWMNLTSACESCNYLKRARPLLAFLCDRAVDHE